MLPLPVVAPAAAYSPYSLEPYNLNFLILEPVAALEHLADFLL